MFRGSLDTIILKMLNNNSEMYGYEISQEVKKLSDGAFEIKEGALYPALHRLEAKGLLETESRSIGNRIRKYYRLSPKGNKESKTQISEMQEFLQQMNSFLKLKPS